MRPLALIISSVWPEPTSSAAGIRTLQLIRSLARIGYDITFSSPAEKSHRSTPVEEMRQYAQGRLVGEYCVRPNDASFDTFISSLKPSAVVFDRFVMEEQFGWRVAKHSPTSLRIVDSQDIHSLRMYRQDIITGKESSRLGVLPKYKIDLEPGTGDVSLHHPMINDIDTAIVSDLAIRELASFLRSDLTLLISSAELAMLKDCVPQQCRSQFLHFPFVFDENEFRSSTSSLSFRDRSSNLVMIGNLRHAPNMDAARCVLAYENYMIGCLDEISITVVDIYGAYGDHLLQRATRHDDDTLSLNAYSWSCPSVKFHGACEDALQTISKHRVMLAPLRFGAGLKGKLFDAMRSQTAFVSTPVGVEGILTHPRSQRETTVFQRLIELSVASTMSELMKKAQRLNNDEHVWREAVELGKEVLLSFRAEEHEALLKNSIPLNLLGDNGHSISVASRRRMPDRLVQRILSHQAINYTHILSKYVQLKDEGKKQ